MKQAEIKVESILKNVENKEATKQEFTRLWSQMITFVQDSGIELI